MKSLSSFKHGVAQMRRLWREERFDRALQEVNRLLGDWPNNPLLLVMRADLIRLQDNTDGVPTLDDVKSDLELAIGLDDDSPAALIELEYFVYVFEDDAKTASKYFQKSIRLRRTLLKDALIGQAKALSELERDSDALACLAEAYSLFSHDGKSGAEDVLLEWKSLQQMH